MEDDKVRFLFGEVPVGLDPDDVEDRRVLLAGAEMGELGPGRALLREVVASQIASGDPPEVWVTAQRLCGLGLDREAVLGQLVMALVYASRGANLEQGLFDWAGYSSALERLPLPTAEEMAAALIGVVCDHQGISVADLDRLVFERLGRATRVSDDELVAMLLDRVTERLVDDDGPLAWLAGDRTVHVGDLTAGVVLTHRLSESERHLGVLSAGFDLAGFARRGGLRLVSGAEIVVFGEEPGEVMWGGPDGWLDPFAAGDVVAVRVAPDGVVALNAVPDEPALDSAVVARVRDVYDREVDQPELPVSAEDIVLGLLLGDRDIFATARPPLAELCQAAGLERRGHEVAHDDQIWANVVRLAQVPWAFDRFDDDWSRHAALGALDAAADVAADVDVVPEVLREVMAGLRDYDVVSAVTDELLGFDDDPVLLARSRRFSDALLAAAAGPAERAVARWLAAVVAEREGDVLVADAHLALALEADPGWGPAVDRSAWYASDKGDAATAARLWRQLGVDRDINTDLAVVEGFTRRRGPKLGRNDRCWCGSGRKFKVCHLGRPEPVPLPERVGWLYRKAVGYLQRRGGSAGIDVVSFAAARAVDPDDPDSVESALDDPIVIDAALCEGGWFERFLTDRGPLLPDDEALLAQAWALIGRTLFEIVETRPGRAMTVRDLGSGDRLEVAATTLSRDVQVGQVICGRAVPDGDSFRLMGAVFPVTPGTETEVLALCDERRGHELCRYAGRRFRPPSLHTREGEPLVACTTVIDVGDETAAGILDRLYQPQDDGWVELHAIDADEQILRAELNLDGDRLTVSTHSEARMDRVVDNLKKVLPAMGIITDTRVPLRPGEMPAVPQLTAGPLAGQLADGEFVRQVQEVQERRWLNEHIPALAGLTPFEAAADPSRVEQLERLLASFPDPAGLPAGAITMRPDHLRRLLGLPHHRGTE